MGVAGSGDEVGDQGLEVTGELLLRDEGVVVGKAKLLALFRDEGVVRSGDTVGLNEVLGLRVGDG